MLTRLRGARPDELLSDTAWVFTATSAVFALSPLIGLAIIMGALGVAAFGCSVAVRWRRNNAEERFGRRVGSHLDLQTILYQVGRGLALGESHPGWRITLYKLNPETREWEWLGRAAADASLSRPPVGIALRADQGVLRTPLGGADRQANAPEISGVLPDPAEDYPDWLNANVSMGLDSARCRQIRMRSRAYWGQVYTIQRVSGGLSTLGMVVETTSERAFPRGLIEDVLSRHYFECLDSIVYAREELLKARATDRAVAAGKV